MCRGLAIKTGRGFQISYVLCASTQITQMRIKANGCRIYYKQVNKDAATTVIFVHGFPFSHKMWNEQLAVLPPTIRGIAYDIRGHGYSEVGDGMYTIELFVDDLADLMKSLKVEKAIICGLSMGGYIAIRFAVKYPEKLLGLVLADTRAEGDTNEAKLKRATSMQKLKTDGMEVYASDSINALLAPTSMGNKKLVQRVKKMIVDTSKLAVTGTLLALAARTDNGNSLDEIKVPTLVVVGEDDAITPPIAAQAIHEGISGSTMEVIPMSGHLSPLENTEVFNSVFLKFLSRF
jgi:pimeloyl-ACP methyl ester carboxylesterase